MTNPKVFILHKFVDGAFGGGNQFLKALRFWLENNELYAANLCDADIVLFNAFPFGFLEALQNVYNLKKEKRNLTLIHRIDGPISMVRGKDRWLDQAIFDFNRLIIDGTIFQTEWSRNQCFSLGMKKPCLHITIPNAPNPDIFNSHNREVFNKGKRMRIITTSWSNNWNKGFSTYQWMDKNVDWSLYEMSFVGNSPVSFKNIKSYEAMPSETLSKTLKQHHVYITASRMEPCSNALIEALHCGLPALGYNNGGNPFLIKDAGLLFHNDEDIPKLLHKIKNNYSNYQSSIDLPSLNDVAQKYYNFMCSVHEKNHNKKMPDDLQWRKFIKLYGRPRKENLWSRIQNKLGSYVAR